MPPGQRLRRSCAESDEEKDVFESASHSEEEEEEAGRRRQGVRKGDARVAGDAGAPAYGQTHFAGDASVAGYAGAPVGKAAENESRTRIEAGANGAWSTSCLQLRGLDMVAASERDDVEVDCVDEADGSREADFWGSPERHPQHSHLESTEAFATFAIHSSRTSVASFDEGDPYNANASEWQECGRESPAEVQDQQWQSGAHPGEKESQVAKPQPGEAKESKVPRNVRYFLHDNRNDDPPGDASGEAVDGEDGKAKSSKLSKRERNQEEIHADAPGKWVHDKYFELYGYGDQEPPKPSLASLQPLGGRGNANVNSAWSEAGSTSWGGRNDWADRDDDNWSSRRNDDRKTKDHGGGRNDRADRDDDNWSWRRNDERNKDGGGGRNDRADRDDDNWSWRRNDERKPKDHGGGGKDDDAWCSTTDRGWASKHSDGWGSRNDNDWKSEMSDRWAESAEDRWGKSTEPTREKWTSQSSNWESSSHDWNDNGWGNASDAEQSRDSYSRPVTRYSQMVFV
eukprot:TRINITY_DN5603_c0_g1_i6.p1 TRINITY_DN5603_c0_g1~~TRINITY_DN5603_c0_g1_i6.p1  ORF type:complete len:537 (+),score=70.36 TRINITY_DN5603_c0_g1_i6:73-1611(+)